MQVKQYFNLTVSPLTNTSLVRGGLRKLAELCVRSTLSVKYGDCYVQVMLTLYRKISSRNTKVITVEIKDNPCNSSYMSTLSTLLLVQCMRLNLNKPSRKANLVSKQNSLSAPRSLKSASSPVARGKMPGSEKDVRKRKRRVKARSTPAMTGTSQCTRRDKYSQLKGGLFVSEQLSFNTRAQTINTCTHSQHVHNTCTHNHHVHNTCIHNQHVHTFSVEPVNTISRHSNLDSMRYLSKVDGRKTTCYVIDISKSQADPNL